MILVIQITQKAFKIMLLPEPHTQRSEFTDQRWDVCAKAL